MKPKLLERRLGERRPLIVPMRMAKLDWRRGLYPLQHRHARHTGAVIRPHGGYRGQRFVLGGQVVNRINLPGDPQFDAKAPAYRSVRLPTALDDGWVRYGARAGGQPLRYSRFANQRGGLFTRGTPGRPTRHTDALEDTRRNNTVLISEKPWPGQASLSGNLAGPPQHLQVRE
jgi:hypothetical protein